MQITEITVGVTDVHKLANYEYVKPEFRITAILEEGDKPDEVTKKLQDYARYQVAQYINTRIKDK